MTLFDNEIFVFGSNLAGIHGAGSARAALDKHGALFGKGVGPQGKSYAIPTKDAILNVLPIELIKPYIDDFIDYARTHPELTFNVVAIGCGYAGYTPRDIAPFFKTVPNNVNLPQEFIQVIYANTQVD
jgi:hypothetical protein